MQDYIIRIQFKVIEEYEYEVSGPDPEKAKAGLLKFVKNIENIDPWKIRRFDVQETNILSCEDKRRVQMVRSETKPKKGRKNRNK